MSFNTRMEQKLPVDMDILTHNKEMKKIYNMRIS